MTTDTRKITTLRSIYSNMELGKIRRKVEYFSGYVKKSQHVMDFNADPTRAVHLHAETSEDKIQLLQDAKQYAFGYCYEAITPQLDWVELEITTSVSSSAAVIELEDAALEILRDRLLSDLTPIEVKALGLQKQAVYLKLKTP